jgi:hypothetical protein
MQPIAQEKKLAYQLEAIWWVLTAVVIGGAMYPIYNAGVKWTFWPWNVIFIVVLLTLSRYVFLLKYTFLAKRQTLKVILLLVMFPLTFAMISGLNGFMAFVDEVGWDVLTGHLEETPKHNMEAYIWGEMLFFGVGSVIIAPIFAVRMFMSVWRLHNRGTV